MASIKLKRICLTIAASVAVVTLLLILFISPLVKYLVEKYDVRYTGRQITMGWAYCNPFTGFVHFSNFKVYEAERDTLFFSAEDVSADFALLKLFSKTYEVSELVINRPRAIFIQKNKAFNFDDLVKRFSQDSLHPSEPSHVNILNVKIEHGEFYYHEKVIPIKYILKDVNLKSTGKRWDADTIASSFNFLSPDGSGGMKGDFTINVKTKHYRLATTIRNFDLEIVRQYLWELINYGMFSAHLNATINATGSFKSADSIRLKGRFLFRDFHFGKTLKDDYIAFRKLAVEVEELSPFHKKFRFDSVILDRPFLNYEKFDSLNNVEMLFGKKGSNVTDVTSQAGRFNLVIEIGRYLKKLSRNFFQSQYKINSLIVKEGELRFDDFSLSEQFSIGAHSVSILADSIDKNITRIKVKIKSRIIPHGDFTASISINPKDSGDFDMTYHLSKMSVSTFNPYIVSYTSFPLDRGVLSLKGVWNVRNGEIKSVNHLILIDPRLSKRVRNKDLKWIPMPLVMGLFRERGNVIDYEIPISGNLKNPHFHLHDVIMDLLKNIFVKPVTIPYGMALTAAENEIEDALTLKWDPRQELLTFHQKNFIEKIAAFLKKRGESYIDVYTNEYVLKEKEQILFFAAKKKYFLSRRAKSNQGFNEADSLEVDKMSIKDPVFMHLLKQGRGAGDTLLFSIQDKCMNYVGNARIDFAYSKLVKKRNIEFLKAFVGNGTRAQVKVHHASDSLPFNGFSYFRIAYKGEIPKALLSAYKEMHEINDESLRKKYFKN